MCVYVCMCLARTCLVFRPKSPLFHSRIVSQASVHAANRPMSVRTSTHTQGRRGLLLLLLLSAVCWSTPILCTLVTAAVLLCWLALRLLLLPLTTYIQQQERKGRCRVVGWSWWWWCAEGFLSCVFFESCMHACVYVCVCVVTPSILVGATTHARSSRGWSHRRKEVNHLFCLYVHTLLGIYIYVYSDTDSLVVGLFHNL